jgi:hypothetical protein
MYTIRFDVGSDDKRDKIFTALTERLVKDGRFRATLTPTYSYGRRGSYPEIHIKPVRLAKKKPYCGNHPGPCQVNPFVSPQKKKNATYLEWNDWVKFHGLVNKTLNKYRINADVWSTPIDVKGKMWIRKGTKARLRYDWTERYTNYGQTIRDWNQGTDDQFVK